MNKDETINKLTEACLELMQLINDCNDTIVELDEENTFLTETIINSKMSKITTERRQIQAKLNKTEAASKNAISEANAIKSEYEQKLDKIAILIKDVKAKQDNIDTYINSQSDTKIQEHKNILYSEYRKQKQELQNVYNKKEVELNLLVDKYRKRQYVGFIIGIVGIVISALTFIL